MVGFGGVTVIEVRVTAVTVTKAEPVTPLREPLMVAGPTATPVTSPFDSGKLLTTALPLEEIQLTWLVQSSAVLSLKAQFAVSCTVVPFAIEGAGGVIEIELRVTAL